MEETGEFTHARNDNSLCGGMSNERRARVCNSPITKLPDYSITKSPDGSITQWLDGSAFEEVDQLDDQDDDDHQFEDEGARLVELLHHEAVEIFGGLQFLFD